MRVGLLENGPWQQGLRDEGGGGKMVRAEVRAHAKALGLTGTPCGCVQHWGRTLCLEPQLRA